MPAFAVTESEVEAQVAATSKGEVAGNVLIWFLCAIAFLKVSQKIDSFMASLGVNVGRTGGSLLAEAMVAMRAITMVAGGNHRAGGRSSPSGSGASGGGSNSGWFLKGGLAGVVSRHITNSAAKTATAQTSAAYTVRSSVRQAGTASATTPPSQAGTQKPESSVDGSGVRYDGKPVQAVGDASDQFPAQDGVIVTGGGSSPSAGNPVSPEMTVPAFVSTNGGAAPVSARAEDIAAREAVPSMDGGKADQAPEGGTSASIPPTDTSVQAGVIVTGGTEQAVLQSSQHTHTAQSSQTADSSRTVERTHTVSSQTRMAAGRPSLGGTIFSRSLASGGSFANNVIGTVARGEVAGSITGDMAAQSLASYMGYTALGAGAHDAPGFSDVEIGRGRITGVEAGAGHPEGLAFAMYHAEQYAAPQGEYTKVHSADGTLWYKQYAQDAVERKPYKAPDESIAYHEKIVKKLPDPPRRKDRL